MSSEAHGSTSVFLYCHRWLWQGPLLLTALSCFVSSVTPPQCPMGPPYLGHQHQDADQHSIQRGLAQQDLIEDGGRQDALMVGHCGWEGRAHGDP